MFATTSQAEVSEQLFLEITTAYVEIPLKVSHPFRSKVNHLFRSKLNIVFRSKVNHLFYV